MRLFEGTEFDVPPKCDLCGKLEEHCDCPPPAPKRIPPEDQTAQVTVEKRKKGKQVTTVAGLDPIGNDLPELLTRLKDDCGAGGTLKDGQIEIQGDQLDRVTATLGKIGYHVE